MGWTKVIDVSQNIVKRCYIDIEVDIPSLLSPLVFHYTGNKVEVDNHLIPVFEYI